MPAPRRTRQEEPASSIPVVVPQRVNNLISVDKYYRSANLLLRQASEYRAKQNDLQLYAMLLRFASLIVETIPHHQNFNPNAAVYQSFKRDLSRYYIGELEQLKTSLKLQEGAERSVFLQPSNTPDTVQISTSNLPQIDWEHLAAHPPPSAPSTASNWASLAPQEDAFPAVPSAPPQVSMGSGNMDLLTGQFPSAQTASVASTSYELPTFQNHQLRAASEATRNRHALLPTAPPPVRRPTSATMPGSLYPSFSAATYTPIDYGPDLRSQGSRDSVGLDQQIASLDMQGPPASASLMDAEVLPRPSPLNELQLGPQEVQVQHMAPPTAPPMPGDSCASHLNDPPPPPPDEQPGAISKQRHEIREVHVSMGLMEEFLAYAQSNTRRGIESCGILAGVLDTKRGLFSITTLIVPKQEGTGDTVQALAEEEIFDVQDKRSLYPMGWIHTHPTQTCFLSSIDVHTQCGYQTMLDEAVAIVMAPSDRQKRCGIFRLSTPGGLKLVQKCSLRGFHTHPPTNTGQPLYELCGHVYLNERLKHDVVDLR